MRSPLLWVALGTAAMTTVGGCRFGYDELALGSGASSGSGGSGGSGNDGSGGSGGSANGAGAGEAGESGAGGALGVGGGASGGSAGSIGSGGSDGGGSGESGDGGAAGDETGGVGGTSGVGGTAGAGGASGSSGGSAGASAGGMSGAAGAGATSGSSGAGGSSGASGSSGAGGGGAGGAGGGGAGAGGSSGAAGGGGYAGAASLGDCQTLPFGGHDYAFCNVLADWMTARDNCATIGMQLARVDSDSENVWLYDNVYDSPPRTGMWIGASDTAVEGEWRWVDGELFWIGDADGTVQNGLYEAWFFLTQPSNQTAIRDCAVLDSGSVGWYDSDCSLVKVFVCESL